LQKGENMFITESIRIENKIELNAAGKVQSALIAKKLKELKEASASFDKISKLNKEKRELLSNSEYTREGNGVAELKSAKVHFRFAIENEGSGDFSIFVGKKIYIKVPFSIAGDVSDVSELNFDIIPEKGSKSLIKQFLETRTAISKKAVSEFKKRINGDGEAYLNFTLTLAKKLPHRKVRFVVNFTK